MNTEQRHINKPLMLGCINDAIRELEKISTDITYENYDDASDLVIGLAFNKSISQICLAWHLRYVTNEALRSMDDVSYKQLSMKVPCFDPDNKFVIE